MDRVKTFMKGEKPIATRDLRLSVILSFANGLLIIAQAFLIASAVTAVAIDGAVLDAVLPSLLLLLPLFLARAVLIYFAEQASFRAGAAVKRDLRARALDHLRRAGPVALAEQPTGRLVTALTDSLAAIEPYYSRYLPTASLVTLLPLAVLVAVVPSDWLSAVVLVVTAPLIPLFMVLIGGGAERMNQRQWQKLARMSGHLIDVIQGLTTLKIFNASRREAAEVARMAEDYRRDTMAVLRLAFLSSLALEFFATVSIAIVAVFIGFRLLWGEMAFFNGFFVLLLAPEFYLPLRTLGTAYHARMEAIGAAERVTELFDIPVPARPAEGTTLADGGRIDISFEDVGVVFADGRVGLDGFSLTVAAGERIALVGPSGAGKSTVLNLLLGFVAPTSGRIRVNGTPLDDIDLADWRQHIAHLSQHPHLFHADLAENIAMTDGVLDEARLETATEAAFAREIVAALPDGFSTRLGERGFGLSGGEIQRIGLARAFYRDAPLVLMDEATAHLDRDSEQKVSAAIDRLATGRTLIAIAHRLETARDADRIVLMEEGRVAATGRPGDFAGDPRLAGLIAEEVAE
ncbi:ATP-binding cassette subfamily C protein CydD [Rhodobium orientis]|uniref:thiol reductant ABC exporter subunit CydD n=1 Tax=Rhodobium orientis TaxID=34017 RepID=UPI001476505F|nr:thiol reductant ABC exporter subunit CydD [Rhodobium orientis]MBB4305002.1 ATP-binding cassette subfamily C protein CydD [Rhodobium orientis]